MRDSTEPKTKVSFKRNNRSSEPPFNNSLGIQRTAKFAKKNRTTILPTKQARWLNDITAVLLFAIAIVIAGMLFTYSPNDRGWFRTSDVLIIHNQFGVLGAYISDILLAIFGKSSWWLVLGIFYIGYRKIMRREISSGNLYSILQIICFVLLLISSTIFEYISFLHVRSSVLYNGYGGLLGHMTFDYLTKHFSAVRVTCVSFVVMLICFSLTFSVSLLVIAEKFGLICEWCSVKCYKWLMKKPVSRIEHVDANVGDYETRFDDYSNDLDNSDATQKMAIVRSPASEVELDLGIEEEAVPVVSKPARHASSKRGASATNILPSTELLTSPKLQVDTVSQETLEFVSMSIENKLSEFGVEAKITNAEVGPVITRYELLPSRGVRGEKIVSLSKEIARGLALTNVRIVETIPGKNSMGIEVPNFKRKIIYLREIFESPIYKNSESKLTLALGKDILGRVAVTDLSKMPHLLVAGTTGSGKSVAINVMILSILFQATPEEVKFIMIDPKMVELSFYQDIPHLLTPVVTDMTQAANALKWTVGEMERRYRVMAKLGCKNIVSFNQKIDDAAASSKTIPNPFATSDNEQDEELIKWPYIVVIIDELADLMMVTGKKIEQYIARIAQKARAVGIHLIVATQRPSVDVITGLIKANIPARIGFQVSSKIDSRTILDQMGAETLLGQGDMLFLQPGSGFPQRIHGAYVNDDELNQVVAFLKSTGTPQYVNEVLDGDTNGVELPGLEDESGNDVEKDTVYDDAVKFIYDSKRCSISSLQTRFGIGYNRAARIMTHMERIGLVRRNDRGGFELVKMG